jgi:hypothetical protein
MKYIIKFAFAVMFLVGVGMALAFVLTVQQEARALIEIESVAPTHLPTKGKGK